MAMTPDTKDFLLHLYDKLWENMGAKEGRLWNYLAVYGAAVALALGAGGLSGVELQSVVLVLGLTMWAVLIVINANWWYQRNRLMVTQIERRFNEAEPGQLDGIIPRAYRDARFRMDSLYRGSVLILSALALLLYLRSMWLHQSPSMIGDRLTVYSLEGIYILAALSIMYCTAQHDSYIAAFYKAKRDLLLEWNPPLDVSSVAKQGEEALANYGWRTSSALALLIVMAVFDYMPARASLSSPRRAGVGVLAQIISIAVFYVILRQSRDSALRRIWLLVVFLLLAASAVVLMGGPASSSQGLLPGLCYSAPTGANIGRLVRAAAVRCLRFPAWRC